MPPVTRVQQPTAWNAEQLALQCAQQAGALWLPAKSTGWGAWSGSFSMQPPEIFRLDRMASETESAVNAFLAQLEQIAYQQLTTGRHGLFLAGYLSYDFGRIGLGIPSRHAPGTRCPLAWVGLYDWRVGPDGLEFAPGVTDARRRDVQALLSAAPTAPPSFACSAFAGADRTEYQHAFERLQAYIAAGDCYQANLSVALEATFHGNPMTGWQRATAHGTPPYAAYLCCGENSLLSFSPEEFLTISDRSVRTRPIKGTRPRHPDPVSDAELRDALQHSEKDRAENLMIVDLLRNDLGRYCETGSVEAPRLFEIESFPAVHHLVSTVHGTLRPDVTPLELLVGCLPGGSITGAPKRRAMEIIDELESARRHTYCGTQFVLDADGNLASSILIRSVLLENGRALCRGGGGIVADSACAAEYREAHDKIAGILAEMQRA